MTSVKVKFYSSDLKDNGCVFGGQVFHHCRPQRVGIPESTTSEYSLFYFVEELVRQLHLLGRIRTAETYLSTLNSFKRFRQGIDLSLSELDSDLMLAYEAFLKQRGVNMNTSSFYMRNLRAAYNRAVEKGLTEQHYPFRYVYTGIDKTVKRAIPLQAIRKIKMLDLAKKPHLEFARDLFLFSFYTRGMSFVDMAYLKKSDLSRGILTYRRRKTGQQLFIKWEKVMQDIVKKYEITHSTFLLPIIKSTACTERVQYLTASHAVNRNLKEIGELVGLSIPLTTYVARHAWASIARSKNIPLSVISEGMGHDSEKTTQIYLTSLDSVAVDKANRVILNSL